jgi:outer membrane protein assembly factor BamB
MIGNIDNAVRQDKTISRWYTIAMSTAFIASIATCIILAFITVNYIRTTILSNQRELELAELKKAVTSRPGDEDALSEIRRLDLQFRENWFYRLDFTQKGGLLLLFSVIIMLAGFKTADTLRKKMPSPGPAADKLKEQIRDARYSRWVLISGLGIIFVWGLLLWLSSPIDFSKTKTILLSFPSVEQVRNWPVFRGPSGEGIVADINVPEKWDVKTNQGIVWKAKVPLPGKNSPIVWNDRIFLSGADPNEQKVFCFDRVSGNLIWTGDVNVPPLKENQKRLKLEDDIGYAPSTMTTDGRSVYAIFPTGVVVCFDFTGNKLWEKNLGRPDNRYGYACSLVMFQNLLLIQFDQGAEEDNKSMLIAMDGSTGNIAWQKKRPVGCSWATPIIINHKGKYQLITLSEPWVIAYNPADGTDLWKAKCLTGDVSVSPSYSNGLVYIIEPHTRLLAIRPDGSGDVTETHIAWETRETTPETSSIISSEKYVFMLMGDLTLGCFSTADGAKLWQKDMNQFFQASPSLIGDKLYLLNEKGIMFIVEAEGSGYKELAKNELGEQCFASPAFVGGRIYIRSKENLFCIGK